MRDDTLPAAGKLSAHVPPVCAYRDGGSCVFSTTPCTKPCSVRGLALAVWMAGYHRTRTQAQVLDRLCNPRDYQGDAEYAPLFAFLEAAKT